MNFYSCGLGDEVQIFHPPNYIPVKVLNLPSKLKLKEENITFFISMYYNEVVIPKCRIKHTPKYITYIKLIKQSSTNKKNKDTT